jgi:TPR repeat protein
MFKVGGFYQEGTSVAQDPVAAVGWYQRAAAAGLPQANFVMGSVALTNGTPTQAVSFFENAALGGMPQAMAALAGVYNNGAGTGNEGVKKNEKLAYVWASLASEAAAQDESIKKAVDDIFGKLSATDKDEAKKLLAAKKKDLEDRRKGPAAAAETPAPATTSPKGKGK